MKIKLSDITCSVIKFKEDKKEVYVDNNVQLKDSPWFIYLTTKNTDSLYESFYATRKHNDHKNDYWYNIKNFDKLFLSIKLFGYRKKLCNNSQFQNRFNGNKWQGGKGPIKIDKNGKICDGHHRCVILYYLFGPNYIINIDKFKFVNDIRPIKYV